MNFISSFFGGGAAPAVNADGTPAPDPRYPADIQWDDASPCHNCAAPCASHEQYPKIPKIEAGPVVGSVKPYSKHLIVLDCGNPDAWPAKIEKGGADSLVATLANHAKDSVLFEAAGGTVMVSASDLPRVDAASDKSTVDILLLPNFRVLRNVPASTPGAELVELCCSLLRDPAQHSIGELAVVDWSAAKNLVLICGHTKRDKRCGFAGKMLSAEFAKELQKIPAEEKLATTGQISHIGGHKWAGNVLIYPSGDWYGRVTTCDVEPIVQKHLLGGKVIKDLWRGRLGGKSNPEDEKEKEKDW